MAFLIGQYAMKHEFLRLEKLGFLKPITIHHKQNTLTTLIDYIINGGFSYFFGYKIIYVIKNYQLFTENPQIYLFSSQGNILMGLICLISTVVYIYKNNQKKEVQAKSFLPSDLSWNILFVAAGSGIVGAKLFAVFENIDLLLKDPVSAIFSLSGLTFYGGLIMGTVCVIIYSKYYKINTVVLADAFAPALILAYGIGRLGCHFSGDGDWGIISKMSQKPYVFPDWLWGYKFPHNVIEAGVQIEGCIGKYCHELPYHVYPTSLYEAIFGCIAFLILWNIKKSIKIPGVLFCIYLIMNGAERFLIEMIRVTEKYNIIGMQLTQAQIIGFLIITIGIMGIVYFKKYHIQHEPV